MDPRLEASATSRRTAIAVGLLLLGAFVTYGGGTALVNTVLAADDPSAALGAGDLPLRVGAMLMLADALFVAVIGVLLYAVGRRLDERISVGYLAARIVEAVGLAVGVVFVLLPVSLAGQAIGDVAAAAALAAQGNAIAYRIAMIALGLGSIPFWYLAYRVSLVPRALAVLGVVGYAIFAAGYALDLMGLDVGLLAAIPGGLFEVAVALWLIFKGFTAPAPDRQPGAAEPLLAPSP